MKEEVAHKGKVVKMTPQVTTVAILQYGVGDEVEVVLKASMGMKAVWLAYFIPLLVLLAVVLLLSALHVGEVVTGICALVAIGLYYLLLYLFRDKLKNEYIFTIKG